MDEQENMCICGCSETDHEIYPDSTACGACTDCVAFEADGFEPNDDEYAHGDTDNEESEYE